MRFIHQLKDWPSFRWDAAEIEAELAEAVDNGNIL